MAEVELELINDRVLSGDLQALPERPDGAEGSTRPDDQYIIQNVGDLMEQGDSKWVIDSILARLRQSAEVRYSFEDEWYFAVRAWFQQFTEEREASWSSDRYMPVILKQVETALPALVAATLDDNGIFRLRGRTRQGKNAAKAMEALMNDQASTYDYDEAYERMYWWAALLGTAYLDHGWEFKEEERFVAEVEDCEPDDEHPDGKCKVFAEKMVTVDDRPSVEVLNPLDVYPAPTAEVGDEADWFIQRVETTIGDLRDLATPEEGETTPTHIDGPALERWISQVKPQEQDSDEASWFDSLAAGSTWTDWLSEIGIERDAEDGQDEDALSPERRVVVLVYRSKFDTITLGGPDHIIGYSRNKNMHGKTGIIIHQFFEIPNCPFGRGIGTILRGHQSLTNQQINLLMDTQMLEAMAPIIVDKSRAQLTDDDLVLQPNSILRVRGTDSVKRLELAAPTAMGMTMIADLAHDGDDLTGFTEQARGLSPSGGQTATAFQGLQSNIRTRLIMHVKRSGRTLRRSGRLLASLNQQYFTKTQIVLRTGDDGMEYVEVQPYQIVGDLAINVSLSTSRASPEARAQRLLQLFQISVPILQGGLLQNPQIRRLMRMLYEANEVEDVDLLFPKGGEKIKDAGFENTLLAKQMPVAVNPAEPHDVHLHAHDQLLRQLSADGADPAILEHVTAHMAEHSQAQAAAAQQEQAAQQAAQAAGSPEQQAQGASGAGVGQGGGDPARQGATVASAATGGQGTPGVAAPGPSAPGRIG